IGGERPGRPVGPREPAHQAGLAEHVLVAVVDVLTPAFGFEQFRAEPVDELEICGNVVAALAGDEVRDFGHPLPGPSAGGEVPGAVTHECAAAGAEGLVVDGHRASWLVVVVRHYASFGSCPRSLFRWRWPGSCLSQVGVSLRGPAPGMPPRTVVVHVDRLADTDDTPALVALAAAALGDHMGDRPGRCQRRHGVVVGAVAIEAHGRAGPTVLAHGHYTACERRSARM